MGKSCPQGRSAVWISLDMRFTYRSQLQDQIGNGVTCHRCDRGEACYLRGQGGRSVLIEGVEFELSLQNGQVGAPGEARK